MYALLRSLSTKGRCRDAPGDFSKLITFPGKCNIPYDTTWTHGVATPA